MYNVLIGNNCLIVYYFHLFALYTNISNHLLTKITHELTHETYHKITHEITPEVYK